MRMKMRSSTKPYTVLAGLLAGFLASALFQTAPCQAGETQHAMDLRSTQLYRDSRPGRAGGGSPQ